MTAEAGTSRRFGAAPRNKNVFTYFYKQAKEASADILPGARSRSSDTRLYLNRLLLQRHKNKIQNSDQAQNRDNRERDL